MSTEGEAPQQPPTETPETEARSLAGPAEPAAAAVAPPPPVAKAKVEQQLVLPPPEDADEVPDGEPEAPQWRGKHTSRAAAPDWDVPLQSSTFEEYVIGYTLQGLSMRFDQTQIRAWVTRLLERRTLVIHSPSQKVLQCVLNEIAQSVHFGKAQHAVLNPTISGTLRDLELCFASARTTENTLLFVDAMGPVKQGFLDDLFDSPSVAWSLHQERLERLNRHMVVTTTPAQLARCNGADGMIPVLEIPFELALISEVEPESERANKLTAEFKRRAERGDWGPTREAQCRALEELILRERLRSCLESGSQLEPPAPGPEIGVDPLVDAVLFVATYFAEIPVADFQDLVLCIVADELEPLAKNEASADASSAAKPKATESTPAKATSAETGEPAKVAPPPPLRRVSERFRAQSQKLLKQLGLRVTTESSLLAKFPSVGFVSPRQRNIVAEQFAAEHHFYYLETFAKLKAAGLLFHDSEAVVQAFVSLAAAQMVGNPQRYGFPWLQDLIVSAGPRLDGVRVEVANPEQRDQALTLVKMLEEHQARHRFIYDRLYFLVREMLAHPSLRGVVHETCTRLCQLSLHEAVLDLAIRLQGVPDFDVLVWFQRVLDEGNAALKQRAAGQLCRLASGGGVGSTGGATAARVLVELRKWALQGVSGRPSREAAFQIAVRIGENALASCPLLENARRRSPGLLDWLEHASSTPEAPDAVVEWLLSPSFARHLDEDPAWPRLMAGMFFGWLTHAGIIQLLPDGGEKLREQLDELWDQAVYHLLRADERPSGWVLQTVVLADFVQRTGASSLPALASLNRALEAHATPAQLRAWVALFRTLVTSLQRLQGTLLRAEPKLSRQGRENAKRVRQRAKEVEGHWRSFGESLARPRSENVRSPSPA
jgi:hypothetical protein